MPNGKISILSKKLSLNQPHIPLRISKDYPHLHRLKGLRNRGSHYIPSDWTICSLPIQPKRGILVDDGGVHKPIQVAVSVPAAVLNVMFWANCH